MPKVTDQTELTAAPAATDMFLVSEISSGLSKKINFSRMISGYRNFTTGAWSFPAPSTGPTVTVNGAASSAALIQSIVGSGNVLVQGLSVQNVTVGAGAGAYLYTQADTAAGILVSYSSTFAGKGSETWLYTNATTPLVFGVNNTKVVTIDGTTRGVTIAAPTSGKAVAVDGEVTVASGTATPAGGTAGKGLTMGTTANLGVFFGSGAPTLSAAQGSLYIRTDGSSTSTRMYVNTTGSTVWTNVTTAT